jgi:hypothetical protein
MNSSRGEESGSVQVRITRAKGEADLVDGPDDATVVVKVGLGDAGLNPAVAFMQGRLKAEGHTGVLFDALASGRIAASLSELMRTAAH